MVTLYWIFNGVEQTLKFANLDDAKSCWQVLSLAGFHAGYEVPDGYRDLPLQRFDGDGLLSAEKISELKTKISMMICAN